jgi:hypothetical protein
MGKPAPENADGRAGERRRTLLRGRICWGPHAALSVDCTIRDLSETGAQLRVPADQPLPSTFHLIEVRDGLAFEASIAWRRDDLVGVRFAANHDLTQAVDGELKHLRRIWLAIAPA